MRELLERWAKVEPERCHATTAGMFDIRCRAQEVIAVVGNLTSARPLGGPWLLAAVIEAIEARNGFWSLTRADFKQPPVGLGYRGRVTGWGVFFTEDEHHGTPAAALLSAYLAALEATQ